MASDATNLLPDLVPARMLNEFVYCPRLAWLEWVAGEWADNADTVEGRHAHRSVDKERGSLDISVADGSEPTDQESTVAGVDSDDEIFVRAQSVLMSAPDERLIARMDVVEGDGAWWCPIDTKKGEIPDVPGGAWEPERVQICAQVLILRANGYRSRSGLIYYAGSKRRVEIIVDEVLENATRRHLAELQAIAERNVPPPPLESSPKCNRCSLVGICLPDETRSLADAEESADAPTAVRRLIPGRDDAQPLYLNTQGMTLGKRAGEFEARDKGQTVERVRIVETSQICIFGNVQITTQTLQECLSRDIPVLFFTYGGWFKGMTTGLGSRNVHLRRAQYDCTREENFCQRISNRLIADKIRNSRTLLRRNHRGDGTAVVARLKRHAARAEHVEARESLLGLEGTAAREYFAEFAKMFRADPDAPADFSFDSRNRRPPRDPVNAMLSFAYSLLAKDWTVTLAAVGLDPFLGFYHQPRFGRPALALDMMEPFRPLIAESTVVWVVNNGVLTTKDFVTRGIGCAMKPGARKKFILAYEQRIDSLITHPVFDYRISYRRVLEVQARLLARVLTREISDLPSFVTR